MTNTEFCCRLGGSNLNAGTRTGNSTEPGTSADFTYPTGTWTSATNLFTAAAPIDGSIAVGDFVSIYDGSPALTGYVARIATIGAPANTNFTTSTTAFSGTKPGDIVATASAKIGGAWKGPNAAENFPFGFVTNVLTNSSANPPRVNLKNDATYNITAAIAHALVGPTTFQGYTTAYEDGGRFTVDGSTNAITLLNITPAQIVLADVIAQNNGSSGSNNGITFNSARGIIRRAVVNNVRANGISSNTTAKAIECEAYACNGSNTAGTAGIAGIDCYRCISHHNTGTNGNGFVNCTNMHFCIAESNGLHGCNITSGTPSNTYTFCNFYNNGLSATGSGISSTGTTGAHYVSNCNFIKNSGFGISLTGTLNTITLENNGFGAGTQVNTSGQTSLSATTALVNIGAVTYASNVTPWVDPANGDFRINLAAAINAGRGTFTQTAASYAGTIGYPDIGAAQHLESGGSSGMLFIPDMAGT